MKTENLLLLLGAAFFIANKGAKLNGYHSNDLLFIYEITNTGLKRITGYPTRNKREATETFKNSNQYESDKMYVAIAIKDLEVFF